MAGRFPQGQQAPSQNRNTVNETPGGWRRFGSPAGQNGGSQAAVPQGNGFRGGNAPTYRDSQGLENQRPSNQVMRGNQMRNDRPARVQSDSGWQRFGAPSDFQNSSPRNNAPSGGGQPLRIAPPVVRERSYSPPSYNAPRQSALDPDSDAAFTNAGQASVAGLPCTEWLMPAGGATGARLRARFR